MRSFERFFYSVKNTHLKIVDFWPRAAAPPWGETIWEAWFCSSEQSRKKEVHDERWGPPGAAACWDWSHNALGRESYEKEWPDGCGELRSGGRFSGNAGEEDDFLGSERSVFMWENRKQQSPMGRRAAPIISSLENTGGETEGAGWKRSTFCLFVGTDSCRSAALCHSGLLGNSSCTFFLLFLWWMEATRQHTLAPNRRRVLEHHKVPPVQSSPPPS